ncbi:MAG: glutamine--fructose-6-phosphate aminotransferase, partial [Desulfobacterales bacterium]|nr:glutamine--fructose-6-phosphate aminotransferase [Desulfobacterales bacterium]
MKLKETFAARILNFVRQLNFAVGKPLSRVKDNTLVFFPDSANMLSCGICALVAYKGPASQNYLQILSTGIDSLSGKCLAANGKKSGRLVTEDFLGGETLLSDLFEAAQNMKQEVVFSDLFFDKEKIQTLTQLTDYLENFITNESKEFRASTSTLSAPEVDLVAERIEKLKDIHWCLKKEVLENITSIANLSPSLSIKDQNNGLDIFKRINAVLNSIDRLEVRGRDSAGISVLCTMASQEFEKYRDRLDSEGLASALKERSNHQILSNNSISINNTQAPNVNGSQTTIGFVYKFAAEIGALGDNISFIRSQIKNDHLLQLIAGFNIKSTSVSAHTRWASVGDITEANCHPVDNTPTDTKVTQSGIIHVCLNGDIDNYLELKTEYEARYDKIHPEINTD